jgi:hypothetical protein
MPAEHERSILWETPGVLSEEERAQLERQWREEFDRSWRPGFSYCKEGRIFTGDVAREYHWLWADVPPALVDRWLTERGLAGALQDESQRGEAVAETSSPHEAA